MKKTKIILSLGLDFLQILTAFVEKSSIAFGLAEADSLKLTLASEEIYSYLTNVLGDEKEIEVICTNGIYFVSVEFFFEKTTLSLTAFNITATPSSEGEEELKEMGLIIAARLVDHLSLEEISDERLILRLIKEKTYPSQEVTGAFEIPAITSFNIKTPNPDEIKVFSHLLKYYYKDHPFPDAFRYPGKLVDMIASSIYEMVTIGDERGFIGGGAVWKRMNEKIVEFFGPYLFNQKDNRMAESIINACLERLARTEIIGVFCRYPTEEFLEDYFEPIGVTTRYKKEENSTDFPCYYRQLHEDAGTYVYVPKSIASFIETEYNRIMLPRHIYISEYSGEYVGEYSVFSSEFDREINQVVLRPLWPGKDFFENISKHLEVFKKEGFLNCFSEIDLGIPWHAYIVDGLIRCNFKPCVIIPYGGKSDLVIFQWRS